MLGELPLHVRVSTRRTRLGLTVERDGVITLRAPEKCSVGRAEDFVRKHQSWIEEKSRIKDRFRPVHPSRALIDGVVFRYLGREYRLLLEDGGSGIVRLAAGRLHLDRTMAADGAAGRDAVIDWYRKVGTNWVAGRLQPWADRMAVPEPAVQVRDLGNRWGAFAPGEKRGEDQMALHWAVFQLPMRLVDYVIAHELAHLRIAGHGADYWRLLRRALPECERLKDELDDMGRRVWLGEVPKSATGFTQGRLGGA
ncbi:MULTISPECIES: M48 family metallopeptidase [unclassified Streptomyces]|uniref:M48 family metallopeptidase n=1 Tax=unclassified Streptomyces TaxID=2593676 RepID=UPI0034375D6F